MKKITTILMSMALFSLAAGVVAYAEEGTTQETATTPAAVSEPMATDTVVPEPVAAPVPPPVEKTTLENLQAAFNGESNAHARYLAFAKKADEEGYGKAASLFRAVARAERIHFERYAKIIKKMGATPAATIEPPVVKSMAENFQAAFDGETYEYTQMYPEFVTKARMDKNENAADAFEDAEKAEAAHAGLYKEALGNLNAWKGKSKKFEVCTFCGNVVEKVNFKKCPLCGKGKDRYVVVR